jgi:hypothetical protein
MLDRVQAVAVHGLAAGRRGLGTEQKCLGKVVVAHP